MQNLNFSQIKPISSLPRNYSELADNTKKKGDIVFLKRNIPHVVLLDFERWQKLMELEQNHDQLQALRTIKESEKEFKSGKAEVLSSLADL